MVGDTHYARFSVSVQGASHIKRESEAASCGEPRSFPCQDRSAAEVISCDDDLSALLLCVCDGHGGAAYFRSANGAQMAIDALRGILQRRMKDIVPLAANRDFEKIKTQLSKAIPRRWRDEVDKALFANHVTEEELSYLREENAIDADEYLASNMLLCSLHSKDDAEALRHNYPLTAAKCDAALGVLRPIYGCTMVAFITFQAGEQIVWLALQIGDGDCAISMDGLKFDFPIPTDPRCFLNQTTSLCDEDAEKEFRFAYGYGIPACVICSSDGVGNCFQDKGGLENFCVSTAQMAMSGEFEKCKNGCEQNAMCGLKCRESLSRAEISTYLPVMSERGSGDDMSIAMLCKLSKATADMARLHCITAPDGYGAFEKDISLNTDTYTPTVPTVE